MIEASVKILVVSWNDAADKNDSVSRDAFVIPSNTGRATAGCLPSFKTCLFNSVKAFTLIFVPGRQPVSPLSFFLAFV